MPLSLIVLALACACAGRGSSGLFATPHPAQPRATADWLRAQPGQRLGEFSFHLLDVAAQPLDDWPGLAIAERSDEAAREFILTARAGAPDDVYLYVTYPSQAWAGDFARLADTAGRADEYALLAIPRRTPDVLVIGITRLGEKRGSTVPSGPLAVLRFVPGFDSAFKQSSAVSTDPRSAPLLTLEPPAAPGGNITLRWDERNIGDYNNNGLVEIGDITQVGQLFKKTTAAATDPGQFELVDGDSNGEINASDLQPIGRNYQTSLSGYMAYQAAGTAPAEDQFVPIAGATLDRADVFAAIPAAQRKHRLQYSFSFDPPLGTYSFLVRAFMDNDPTAGMPSNVVEFTAQPDNQPPFWESSVGITSVDGLTGGLRVHFGRALDPEGGVVTYVLRYVQGGGPVGGPGTIDQPLPATTTSGNPPYTYDLLGLASGTQYTLLLVAEDDLAQRTTNTAGLSATTPGLTMPTDPWCCYRGNPMRTGSNPTATMREPLVPAWSVPVTPSAGRIGGPLVSSAGWTAVQDANGIRRYSLADGVPVGQQIGLVLQSTGSLPALDGMRMVVDLPNGASLADLNTGNVTVLPSPSGQPLVEGPLLLGDYFFGLESAGSAFSELTSVASIEWLTDNLSATRIASTDGGTLFCLDSASVLRSFALTDGAGLSSQPLGSDQSGLGPTCNTMRGLIYAATYDARVEARTTNNLGLSWTIPRDLEDTRARTPLVVAEQFNPPMLLTSSYTGFDARLQAASAETGAPLWEVEYPGFTPTTKSPVCGTDRIYWAVDNAAGTAGKLLVLHPSDGSLLQELDTGALLSEVAPATDRLLLPHDAAGAALDAYREDATLPITWTGTIGIKQLTPEGTNGLRVHWDAATASAGLVVRYVVYRTALTIPGPDGPPIFGPSSDFPVGAAPGPQGHLLANLTPGQRYSVGVRAYYGKWGENAVTDGNTNWLAATPAWTPQPPLDLGAAPPPGGTQLPDGEVYLMQGVLDDAGRPHVVYNDEADTHLTHVYMDATGAWQVESANIGTHIANDFELQWVDGNLHIAYTEENNGDVGILTRTGADTWTDDAFTANTVANPQVAFALGNPPPTAGQGALVYNKYASGSGMTPDTDYNIVRTDAGGNWLASAPFDTINFCGRDLAAALNPADLTPWVALQRGNVYAPNRLTPQCGELLWATDDGAGGYSFTLVDAGDNPNTGGGDTDSSDVGKRVRLAMDSAGLPHMAYLDLNASASVPLGQLKYARYTGTAWTAPEQVTPIDLSFQSFASLQYTWGELSFGLTPAGSPGGADVPVIGMLGRTSATNVLHQAHLAYPLVYVREGGWRVEQLDATQDVYPNDREPCVLLLTPDAWHFFLATSRDTTPQGQRARRIKHWTRAL